MGAGIPAHIGVSLQNMVHPCFLRLKRNGGMHTSSIYKRRFPLFKGSWLQVLRTITIVSLPPPCVLFCRILLLFIFSVSSIKPPTMRIPPYPLLLLLLTPFLSSLPLAMGVETHGEEESKEMGPVGFMWPPDREWGAAQDNTPPCGSKEGVTERTDFPMRMFMPLFLCVSLPWDVKVC